MESLIPEGMVIDTSSPDAIRYTNLCRTFRHIRKALPKIDDFELTDDLQDLDIIFQNRFDAEELGEVSASVTIERYIYAQGESLQEYRFRFGAQRRTLVRSAMGDAIAAVDVALTAMSTLDFTKPSEAVTDPHLDDLKKRIAEIDVLKGTAVKSPARWADLRRHMHFGFVGDVDDIIKRDWPEVKESLQSAMYGPDDPMPVDVSDLGALVKDAPSGPVVTALKWDALDDEGFERLIFNILSEADGYSNVQWLTATRAQDRGRDISATKTIDDSLSGSRALRVIIQCKHWRTKGIGMTEVTKLVNQIRLWEPPKVDELVIATSGRFSSDAVDWIEKRNNDRTIPLICMWPDSHLESLLAPRPHLVAQFRLR